MPSLTELASYLESIAPAQTAENWDNVGVLVRCAQEVTGVLCALDITPATVREARAVGCNAIVSHHPVIFRPLKELRQGDVPALLVREGVSAVCMHTNLDKAQGGVNDVLAQALGLRDTEPFAGGIGRVGALPETMEAAAFAQFVGKALAAPVKWADAHGPVRRVAVVSGSGGDFSAEAAAAGADCLVTGEAGHHDALDALAAGVTLVAATHFATETAIAGVLAHRSPKRSRACVYSAALRMRTLSFIFNNGEARSFGRRIAAFDAAARAEPWPACIHKFFWNAETVFDRLRYILYNVMIDSKE